MREGFWLRRIAYVVYVSLILGLAGASVYVSPGYAWDMLPYIGVALSYDTKDPAVIHEGAYGAVQRAAPSSTYGDLTTNSFPYRAEVARDPGAFVEQLPFYRERVIYCRLIYLLHKAGMSFVRAVFVISALACASLALLSMIWTRRYIGDLGAILVSLLVCFSFPFLQSARAPGADGLAALVVATAAYVYLEKNNTTLFFALLTLAVLVRHESVILGLMFAIYFLLFHRAGGPRVRAARFAACAGALLGAYGMVDRLGGYGWRTLFYHTFIRFQAHPATAAVPVGADDYARVFVTNLVNQAPRTFAVPYLLVLALGAAFYFRARDRRRLDEPLVTVIVVLLLNLVIRTLLFPILSERFFLAHYLIFAAVSVRMLRESSTPSRPSPAAMSQ